MSGRGARARGAAVLAFVLALAGGEPPAPPAGAPEDAKPGDLPPGAVWRASETAACSLALSPDGKVLAAGTKDGEVLLLGAETGRETKRLPGRGGAVVSLAFSPDGKTLAAAGGARTFRVWDAATGRESRVPRGGRGASRALAFSPDGRLLAEGGDGDAVRIWDARAWTRRDVLAARRWDSVNALAFSPDGKTLAAGSAAIRLWDVPAEKEIPGIETKGKVESLAFSPDGRALAAVEIKIHSRYPSGVLRFWSLHIWDAATRKDVGPVGEMWESEESGRIFLWPCSLAFSPDGRFLALGGRDGSIGLWDATTRRPFRKLKGRDSPVLAVAFSPDGNSLFSCGEAGDLVKWDLVPPRPGPDARGKAPSPEDLDGLLKALGGEDDREAGRAALALARWPDATPPFLKKSLPPRRTDAPALEKILVDLDDPDSDVRQKAFLAFWDLGPAHETALRERLKGELKPLARYQIEKLLAWLEGNRLGPMPFGDALCRMRAIGILEWIATPAAREVLEAFAKGPEPLPETQAAKAALGRLKGR